MKILIVERPSGKKIKYQFFEKTLLTMFSILPTLYIRRIAAITPKKHSVSVVNERYEQININKHYDLVNIHFTAVSAAVAYELADKFRKKNITVVLSGLHASALPDEAKKHADSVLIGRGELNWLTLLKDAEKNELKSQYQPEDYERSSVKIPPTNVALPGFTMTGAIEATRGCPYRCAFCPEANTPNGSKFYTKAVDEVIDEIKAIPQKTIMFYDASLTINPSYTKKLFTEMKGLHKKFFCNGNVDVLANDEELVRLSKEAGCIAWLIGFESISQQTIENVGKTTNNVDTYERVVKNLHKHKMVVIGDFMFGFDTDTKDVFDETLKAIKELKIDVADFTVLTPFPGTPIFNKFEKEGRILTKDWSKYSMHNVVFEPKNMSSEELIEGVKKMYANFYSPQHTVKRVVHSLYLGAYPFFLVLARNAIANISSRKFSR
jgi:radical SAM superfamily enzyme YgiQ (UPF0313 family)